MRPGLHTQQQAGISLIAVIVMVMLITGLAMMALFYVRYQSLPWQANWGYWLKSPAAASPNPANSASSAPVKPVENNNLRPAATVKEGIKRCQIDGKIVYSDTLCQSQKHGIQLHDNVVPAVRTPAAAAASASAGANQKNRQLDPD